MPDRSLDTDDLPADATDEEAAAIAAAIAAYRDEQAAAAAAAAAAGDGDSEASSRRSWGFSGRLAGVGIESNRAPSSAPGDGWRAASRSDRF
ncbi:MAG: acc operon protein [Haloarculaceae archaeon]